MSAPNSISSAGNAISERAPTPASPDYQAIYRTAWAIQRSIHSSFYTAVFISSIEGTLRHSEPSSASEREMLLYHLTKATSPEHLQIIKKHSGEHLANQLFWQTQALKAKVQREREPSLQDKIFPPNRDSNAARVTTLRAIGAQDSSFTGERDNLARHFVFGRAHFWTLPGMADVGRWLSKLRHPGHYFWVNVREAHGMETTRKALKDGIRQIVMPGAGYLSRGIRLNRKLAEHGAKIFEVDLPEVQNKKRDIIASHPEWDDSRVQYVPGDLTRVRLGQLLNEKVGFNANEPTLFLLEGLTVYLDEPAVRNLLSEISTLAAPGSEIATDYSTEDIIFAYGGRQVIEGFHQGNNAPKWLSTPEKVAALMKEAGFEVQHDLGPADFERRYLARKKGTVVGRSVGFKRIVQAVKPCPRTAHRSPSKNRNRSHENPSTNRRRSVRKALNRFTRSG